MKAFALTLLVYAILYVLAVFAAESFEIDRGHMAMSMVCWLYALVLMDGPK